MEAFTHHEFMQIQEQKHLSATDIQHLSLKIFSLQPEQRTAKCLEVLSIYLRDVSFFQKLSEDLDRQTVLKCLKQLTVRSHDASTVICKRGDPGFEFFIILSGRVQIYVLTMGAPQKQSNPLVGPDMVCVTTLGEGQAFGELALIRDAPRMATIITETPCQFAILSKQDYKMVLAAREEAILEAKRNELAAAFKNLSNRGLQQLVYLAKPRTYGIREFVVRQGVNFQSDPVFFLVRSGEFEVHQHMEEPAQRGLLKLRQVRQSQQICMVFQGELVGELEMFRKWVRQYSVRCVTETGSLYAINYHEFQRMLLLTSNMHVLDQIKEQTRSKYRWMQETTQSRRRQHSSVASITEEPSNKTTLALQTLNSSSSIPTPDVVTAKEQILSKLKQQRGRQSVKTEPKQVEHQATGNKQSVIESLIKAQRKELEEKQRQTATNQTDPEVVYVRNGRKDAHQMYWPVQATLFLNQSRRRRNSVISMPVPRKDLQFQLKKIFSFKMRKQVNICHYKSYSFMS